jgi:DNA polymerase-1
VVQASAADWALVLLVTLRAELAKIMTGNEPTEGSSSGRPAQAAGGRIRPELVFFQHDEVIVHCPQDQADAVVAAVTQAGWPAAGVRPDRGGLPAEHRRRRLLRRCEVNAQVAQISGQSRPAGDPDLC